VVFGTHRVIAGNRFGGAAVWVSGDATEFRVIERAPGLANDQRGSTLAVDVVASRGDWIVVGSFTPKGGIDRKSRCVDLRRRASVAADRGAGHGGV
jgi:hypothetical protein